MHQPRTEPRRSIYYDYQVHAPWLPSQHGQQPRHKVVIAGGGPVGLTAALELARHGVSCVLLESELQVSEGSRAIVFTRRSMEILQQVGVANRVMQHGLPWRFGNSFYRGQQVFRMEAPHDDNDRFWPMINLQQQFLEEFLVDACEAHPLIELRWGNRVTGLVQHEGHAEVEVDTPEGPYTLETEWLVASDGARSAIRSLLDLQLEGASYEGRFVIADIRIDLPLPTERLAFFDPPWNPRNTVLMHREPLDIWRVDYQLPEGETPEQALAPESLKARINAQLEMIGHGGKPWEMDWCSVYSARTLTLPDYRAGRTLFIGDAAHLLPIFGVRGANTGFQDAQALGWRLGLVCSGQAPEILLASYSQERVGAAREIIDEAGKSTRFMTRPAGVFGCCAMRCCRSRSPKTLCARSTTGAPRVRMNTPARRSTAQATTTRCSTAARPMVHHRPTCGWGLMTSCSTTWAAALTCWFSRRPSPPMCRQPSKTGKPGA